MPDITYLHETEPFSKDHVDPHALKVIHRLKQHGHPSYLVGGSVRDLLLKKSPKDYDIATSARPEEIKALFKNCLLIGRRFRLAHIRYGHKILEVSTFRSGTVTNEDFITHDNEFGTEEQDARRRDFTINGLLYDPEEHAVLDYVEGFKDIRHGTLRTIGDPQIRFRQDPVRMIRLLKFVARFDFSIDPGTEEALKNNVGEIVKSSSDRVLGEIFKMLETHKTAEFLQLLIKYGFLEILLPELQERIRTCSAEEEILRLLAEADRQEAHAPEKNVLFACILFPILREKIKSVCASEEKTPHLGDIFAVTADLIHELLVRPFPRFPRWMRETIAFVLNAQYRFTPIDPKKRTGKFKLLNHKKAPLAVRFLGIRAAEDERCAKEYGRLKKMKRKTC